MYILYSILGVIAFLVFLLAIVRFIWMQETHPKKKNKSDYVDSSMRCDKPWNNRVHH